MMDILLTTHPDDPPEDPELGGMIVRGDGAAAGNRSGGREDPAVGPDGVEIEPDPLDGTTGEPSGEAVVASILSLHASGMALDRIVEILKSRQIEISWKPSDQS